MPVTEVRAFCDERGRVPLQEWLDDLEEMEPKAFQACLALILKLAAKGHELRRPTADYLDDGVYELRTAVGNVNYRILYFFFDKNMACCCDGLTKEKKVPTSAINAAKRAKRLVKSDPDRFTANLVL